MPAEHHNAALAGQVDAPPPERHSPNAGRLLVADELAARWQVLPDHVYRLAREGALPTVRLGRYRRWRLEDVEAFERSGGAANV